MNRGDVVRVDLPAPKGTAGREQIGERPAVVVQIGNATANLSTVILVPFTSSKNSLRLFGSVNVSATPSNGLAVDSVALVHQLRAIDKHRIRRVDGRVSDTDLMNIESKVREILGL